MGCPLEATTALLSTSCNKDHMTHGHRKNYKQCCKGKRSSSPGSFEGFMRGTEDADAVTLQGCAIYTGSSVKLLGQTMTSLEFSRLLAAVERCYPCRERLTVSTTIPRSDPDCCTASDPAFMASLSSGLGL